MLCNLLTFDITQYIRLHFLIISCNIRILQIKQKIKSYIIILSHHHFFSNIYFYQLSNAKNTLLQSQNEKLKHMDKGKIFDSTPLYEKTLSASEENIITNLMYLFMSFPSFLQTKIRGCWFLPLCVFLILCSRHCSINCLSHSPVCLRNLSVKTSALISRGILRRQCNFCLCFLTQNVRVRTESV